jgi:hypothetical protein
VKLSKKVRFPLDTQKEYLNREWPLSPKSFVLGRKSILSPGHTALGARFTPRGRANSPGGQLHEILAFFGLEAGLNYTLY